MLTILAVTGVVVGGVALMVAVDYACGGGWLGFMASQEVIGGLLEVVGLLLGGK